MDDPVLAAALEDDSNLEEEQMSKLMGFGSFDTTKVKHAPEPLNVPPFQITDFKTPKVIFSENLYSQICNVVLISG